jgi:hypothetical protein
MSGGRFSATTPLNKMCIENSNSDYPHSTVHCTQTRLPPDEHEQPMGRNNTDHKAEVEIYVISHLCIVIL